MKYSQHFQLKTRKNFGEFKVWEKENEGRLEDNVGEILLHIEKKKKKTRNPQQPWKVEGKRKRKEKET